MAHKLLVAPPVTQGVVVGLLIFQALQRLVAGVAAEELPTAQVVQVVQLKIQTVIR